MNISSVFIKAFNLYFDYVELDIKRIIQYRFVDTRTILFETPACLMAPTGENQSIPIIIMQDGEVVEKLNFVYLARKFIIVIRTKYTVFL